MLLKLEKIDYDLSHFPQMWQAVIFRNYGKVKNSVLAEILHTDENTIIDNAKLLGLENIKYNLKFLELGYLYQIRVNWHILSYNQLLTLLNITEEKLSEILFEDDFMFVKMGNFKPEVEEAYYTPLTDSQLKKTLQIREIVTKNYIIKTENDFAFIDSFNEKSEITTVKRDKEIFEKIIYSYFAPSGDIFLKGDFKCFPDGLLSKLAELNITGIWVHGLLSKMTEFPFDNNISKDWQIRLSNINILIEKLKKFRLKLYIYFNEPRCMPLSFFDKYPELLGSTEGNNGALCTSLLVIKDYLYYNFKYFFENVKELGGIMTITMSENLTNCYSRVHEAPMTCLRCKDKKQEEIAAEVNNIIAKSIKDSNSDAKLLAWTWGWADYMHWDNSMINNGIQSLDKSVNVVCVSEDQLPIKKLGVKSKVIDYSMSNIGPSRKTIDSFNTAKESGHKIYAKVQVNNTWECSAVPYIPAFGLINRHMDNLKRVGINGLVLSWTLGGYPSPNLDLVNQNLENKYFDIDLWFKNKFGKNHKLFKRMSAIFEKAFVNFPFNLNYLYNGTQNFGASNLMYFKKTNIKSTMCGFCYDDIDTWRGIFSRKKLAKSLNLLSKGFLKADKLLEKYKETYKNDILEKEISLYVKALSAIYQSCYNQVNFIITRDKYLDCKKELYKKSMLKILDNEFKTTKKQYYCATADSKIGYEASNHYYFTENSFLEKLINIEKIKADLKQGI